MNETPVSGLDGKAEMAVALIRAKARVKNRILGFKVVW